jgi:alkanesulfonate monooxygenase SsuD/methylene tetrahydromethanopterin reductase-like flavin-dependent oxidoreductase (luciferase family)
MWEYAPAFENSHGSPHGGKDMSPKPATGRFPLLIPGGSQQGPGLIARHGDGWITHPPGIAAQARIINDWRARVEAVGDPTKPAVQSLFIDLAKTPQTLPQPIHLGFRLGTNHLRAYLKSMQQMV